MAIWPILVKPSAAVSTMFDNDDSDPDVTFPLIPLAIFSNPNGLKQLGGGKYSPTDLAGKIFMGNPSSAGFGNLETGYVEGSNVDITTEMTNMIRAQQQFNGAARIMQTNSDMIEKLTR